MAEKDSTEKNSNEKANTAREGAYSVVRVGNHSFPVAVGDKVDILWNTAEVKEGDELSLEEVLLTKNDGGDVTVGTPLVAGSAVKAKVLKKKLGDKIFSYKKTRRHGFHKKQGHRQDLLHVEVTAI